jgi:hypothetical protein
VGLTGTGFDDVDNVNVAHGTVAERVNIVGFGSHLVRISGTTLITLPGFLCFHNSHRLMSG